MNDLALPETWQDVERSIAAIADKDLLFVTGSVKAGTTWTQLWLDRHPQIACRGEGYFFNKFAGALQTICNQSNAEVAGQNTHKGDKHPDFPPITLPHIQYLLRQTVLGAMAVYGGDPALKVVAEKTPSTVLALDAVLLCFPEAKILHCIRDGRDMAISAWHDNLRKAGEQFLQVYPTLGTFLPEIAQIWVNHQVPILKHLPQHADRIRCIHYEDLLDRPETILGETFDWLGVDASGETVAGCLSDTRFEKLADGRKPGEVDIQSFFRKGTAGQWRDDMTAEQVDRFWQIAGSVMDAVGYDRDGRISGVSPSGPAA